MEKIRIGIVGYGNIGRGVEQAIARNEDMELKAVFTRRAPAAVAIKTEGVTVKHFDDTLQTFRLSGRRLRRTLIRLTALIPMRRFRSILQMWTRRREPAAM